MFQTGSFQCWTGLPGRSSSQRPTSIRRVMARRSRRRGQNNHAWNNTLAQSTFSCILSNSSLFSQCCWWAYECWLWCCWFKLGEWFWLCYVAGYTKLNVENRQFHVPMNRNWKNASGWEALITSVAYVIERLRLSYFLPEFFRLWRRLNMVVPNCYAVQRINGWKHVRLRTYI